MHGWRELLNEIGVIVVGVLIALAGEQAVEAYHWHDDLGEARATLDAELQDALSAATERTTFQKCTERQIASLQAIVAGHGRTPPIWPHIHVRSWSTSAWQSVTASNVLGHMKTKDRLKYAEAFSLVDAIRGWNRKEYDLWSDVGTLRTPSVLSDTARDRLQSDLARADGLNFMASLAPEQLVEATRSMGITLNADNRQALEDERKLGCRKPTQPRPV